MTDRARAWREAVTLPWLLIGVALAASIRITLTGDLRIVPPTLSSLVLALVLMSVLVRSGQLVPGVLVASARRPIENAAGLAAILALGWASAGVLTLVVPETGLPKLAGLVLVTALLANTLAASSGRLPALRALFVTCLAGFVVKFLVLDALFDPARGLGGRLVTALLGGVTLGGFAHVPWAPVTGYLAFGTLLVYFAALVLLPRPALSEPDLPALRPSSRVALDASAGPRAISAP